MIAAAIGCLASCQQGKKTYVEKRWDEQIVQKSFKHKYGMEVTPSEWAARGRSGEVILTQKNGVEIKQNYEYGHLHGETTYTFPYSGSIEKTEHYVEGQLIRTEMNYPSGAKLCEISYKNSNDFSIRNWYEMGGNRSFEEYESDCLVSAEYYTPNQQIEGKVMDGEGVRINRSSLGVLISRDTIVDGVLTLRTILYPNESPKEIIPYKNGMIAGEKRTYTPTGEPLSIEQWVNGHQQGITVVYQNGERVSEIAYVQGKKHGIERRFRDGDHLIEEISWRRGQRHGPSMSYLGEATRVDWYQEGTAVTKAQYKELSRR